MNIKKNVVTVDRQLASNTSGISIRIRNINDTAVGNVRFALHCSDSLYMDINSEFIFLF